ncbi:MAG: tyrosine-type recombinase/integrase [Prevotella sp.]|nr:tyrosine-type recombinase/integrase [Prevotella sp.]
MSSYRKLSKTPDSEGRYKYELSTTYGKDRLTGKYIRYSHTVLCKEKEVEDQWTLFRASVINGTFEKKQRKNADVTPAVPRTVSELCDAYIADLTPSVSHNYIQHDIDPGISAHIKPLIGNALITEILPMDIQKLFIAPMHEGHHGRKGLAPKTIRNYVSVLSQVFQYALRNNFIAENPCNIDRLVLPKSSNSEAGFYTLDELDTLVNALKAVPDDDLDHYTKATACMCCLTTGMRKSEALGLDWEDISFDTCQGRITKTRYLKKKKYREPGEEAVQIGDVKTEKSRRIVVFPLEAIAMLQTLKDLQDDTAHILGSRIFEPSPAVFRGVNGRPLSPKALQRYFRKICDDNGLPVHGMHGLRHTFASMASTLSDVGALDVSRYLGHSQLSTTQNIYTHLLSEKNNEIAQGVASIISKDLPKTE